MFGRQGTSRKVDAELHTEQIGICVTSDVWQLMQSKKAEVWLLGQSGYVYLQNLNRCFGRVDWYKGNLRCLVV